MVNLALVEPGPCGWPAMRARIDLEDGDAEHSQAREADAVPSGFARLLARLNPDPDEAGQEYQRLRTRLVRFFDWRGATQPDECADETLDRLARKLEEAEVEVLDVQKYVYGIARLVHLEQRRRPAWSSIDDTPSVLVAPAPETDETPLQDAFERCLAELPADSRRLLLQYYDGEGRTKIENRRRLAAELGVTDNALRSRVQRLRDLLERSVLADASATARPGR